MKDFVETYNRVFERRKELITTEKGSVKLTVPIVYRPFNSDGWHAILEDATTTQSGVERVRGAGNTPFEAIQSLEKQLEIYINDPI